MPHAFLPPSAASSWSQCALWATMNARFPQEDSPEGIEGTSAHSVAWEIVADRSVSIGANVTEEMIEGGELLADTINERKRWTDGIGHVEETLRVPYIPDCFGTPDYWGWNPANLHIEIVDYKFGHRFVDEFFNPQGLLYLTAIIESIMRGQPMAGKWSVSFTIV